MADINIQIKQRNGAIWDNLFPRTKAENVEESTSKRFVSDTEKATLNAKQDELGYTPVPDTRKVAGKALTADITLTKDDVGLSNVENKSSATIRGELTSTNVTNALGFTPLNAALKGANNGVAELDATGKIPAAQLPSYVDDVLDYDEQADFPATGEAGIIYVAKDTNKTYRWSGSGYVEISASLALGETSATAYRGDRGKIAYDHSQTAHAPANAQKNSDITKEEIEAKLTGNITSHTHSGLMPADHGANHVTGGSDIIPDAVADSKSGLMSAADKAKLDGIEAGANKYIHPTSAGNKHIPSGGSSGQVLKYSASGTAAWATLKAQDVGTVAITIGESAPEYPETGDLWYEIV